ncbi:hypothetical protein B0H13DRAFT_1953623 [Mycena leptocephala]|nr:hypothetical protein B0H13DRAFT_1953623 [Mycena leptocephala]
MVKSNRIPAVRWVQSQTINLSRAASQPNPLEIILSCAFPNFHETAGIQSAPPPDYRRSPVAMPSFCFVPARTPIWPSFLYFVQNVASTTLAHLPITPPRSSRRPSHPYRVFAHQLLFARQGPIPPVPRRLHRRYILHVPFCPPILKIAAWFLGTMSHRGTGGMEGDRAVLQAYWQCSADTASGGAWQEHWCGAGARLEEEFVFHAGSLTSVYSKTTCLMQCTC